MASWSEEEFDGISFGDTRLNERFLRIADSLLEKPSGSISEITGSWAETKASYRFFGNEKVTKSEILRHHIDQTMVRISTSGQAILAIQDTTYLDFTHHPKTQGLGKLTRPKKGRPPLMGLVLHNTLAITSEGECLGLLDQKIYKRADEDLNKTQSNKTRPIEKKESYRWIEVVKKISSACSASNIVYVCDREGDIFEFFSEVVHQSRHSFLIRAGKDRIVGERCPRSSQVYENTSLWNFMQTQHTAGQIQIELSERQHQPARKAHCSVRFAPITYTPPYRRPAARSTELLEVPLYAIWVKEDKAPTGVEPIEWMLLTNIKVDTFEDACEKLSWYKARWHIENYHKVLKSGCNIEKSKLNHADKLEKFATLMSVIAARIYQLKLMGRNKPMAPCTTILHEEEWKILYRFIHKTKAIPPQVPTAKEVMFWIAKLGGFLGRKGDGNPGSIVIWRGWQRFMDILEGWKSSQLHAT